MISQGLLVSPSSTQKRRLHKRDNSLDGVLIGGTGWQQRFDNASMTPYVWNNVTGEFITYDDPVSISYKREYARQQGMQGMMMWEISYDVTSEDLVGGTGYADYSLGDFL
jgi:GH18 family chitinase